MEKLAIRGAEACRLHCSGGSGGVPPSNCRCSEVSMARIPSAVVVTPVLRLHQAIYRGSRGWIGKRLIGRSTLLLTTLGRRTGRERTNALIYYKDGSSLVVVASNGGSDHGPGWLANLRAEPHVVVQVGTRKWSAYGAGRLAGGANAVVAARQSAQPRVGTVATSRRARPLRRLPASHVT